MSWVIEEVKKTNWKSLMLAFIPGGIWMFLMFSGLDKNFFKSYQGIQPIWVVLVLLMGLAVFKMARAYRKVKGRDDAALGDFLETSKPKPKRQPPNSRRRAKRKPGKG